ncbi:MAG: MobC family plasmid mobilization relaxosome protein [Gemmatimonadetes bacterium]|nr:MobC family plasmid mobilization relaxosome protein [Gemmatimonadota bacterium]
MSAGRPVWVKVRASDAERAEWHAKARSAGLTLSDLVRRSLDRARTWTVPHAEVERERTREAARIGNNLNQIARWANTHKGAAEAVEVLARLVAIERALTALARFESPDDDDAH